MMDSNMINITNVETTGITRAIYSARNAMNSWNKSDSDLINDILGCKDFELAKKLSNAGNDHSKYLRMIVVYCDIVAPLYWWKEFDTYKVGTVRNSCSTMHKIHEKEFTLDDFSYEHLFGSKGDGDIDEPLGMLQLEIDMLNDWRKCFLQDKDKDEWWQMIQLLPSSYNQRSTVLLNYQVLKNMYHSRKNHKLDEWREFCEWIETLPYSELITGKKEN